MKNSVLFNLCLFLIVFSSCRFAGNNGEKEQVVDHCEANGRAILTGTFMGMPIGLNYVDGSLMVYDAADKEAYKAISLKGNKVFPFLKRGAGPHEMLIPRGSINSDLDLLVVHCSNTHKKMMFSISDLLSGVFSPLEVTDVVENDQGFLFNFCVAGKGRYVGNYHFFKDDHTYALLDENFKVINKGGSFPVYESSEKEKSITKSMVFQGRMFYNNKRNQGGMFYSQCRGFDLFKVDGDSIRIIRSELLNKPLYKVVGQPGDVIFSKENENGYLAVDCSDDYIYALYSGKSLAATNNNLMEIYHSNKVHVFDWDGHLVREITLDHPVNTFCIKDDSLFYGINAMDEPLIYEFSLK